MSYQKMREAVFSAYRKRQNDQCFALLDEFSETALGEELGKTLALKAGLILLVDVKRATEGLSLVEEAQRLLESNPEESMGNLITGLGLCHVLGDVERAKTYEVIGNRLMQRYASHNGVSAMAFRFHTNLGNIATGRGEHAAAYWHYRQALEHLLDLHGETGPHTPPLLVLMYMNIASSCLRINRLPEAAEALKKAERSTVTDKLRLEWAVVHAEYLRRAGLPDQAAATLERLPLDSEAWTADSRTQLYITRALVARDVGDLRQYNRALSLAQQVAIDKALDYRLSEIQRMMRAQ